ncbi:MAG: glutamine synthetase [Treponema sp.]|nr:glutamine synthetase [Treponema sp.]
MYTKKEVLEYISENGVKFIKLFFLDVFGNTKSISIQPHELERAFESGISFDASSVPGFLNVTKSDLFLIPDPSTLSVLPWRPQQGKVVRFFCNICYPDGKPFEGDMRTLLAQSVEEAKKSGYELKAGTECEFYLFKLDEKGERTQIPLDGAGYCDLAPLDKGENVRRQICLYLEQMGIQPESSHHESGPGQQEVDFKYSSLLNAADNLSTFKTVVSTVANSNGLYADFRPAPAYSYGWPGNGLHINISVYKDGKNIFASEPLSDEAKSFMAGIMERALEISRFTNPVDASYQRLGRCEAPKYVSWSRQNRSQFIRVPAAAEEFRRIELRSPDPTCNQYLVLTLILKAGLEGIQKKLKLQDEVNSNLYEISSDEAEEMNLVMLPTSLNGAIDIAKKSDFIKSVLPEVTLKAFGL